jgi:hypothetical protein
MKNKKGKKKIDPADVREELDRLFEQVKKSKSALQKLSKSIPDQEEKSIK